MEEKTQKMIDSYACAKQIMEDHATSFYYAFQHLPLERFRAITAIYAFCRYADDTVDEQILVSRELVEQQLDELSEAVEQLYTTNQPFETPLAQQGWWLAFTDTVKQYRIKKEDLLSQIAGQRMDADFADIQTEEELYHYCTLVAGSVGRMILPLMAIDEKNQECPNFAIGCESLGHGLQLTNILRDIGEDIRFRNRVYIPANTLKEYGISREQLVEWAMQEHQEVQPSKEFIALWEKFAAMADEYYQKFESYVSWYHPECRIPLVASGRIYRAIADAVREQGYDCFTKRCYTTAQQRQCILSEVTKFVQNVTEVPHEE